MNKQRLPGIVVGLVFILLALTACNSGDASKTATQGDELFSVTFDTLDSWETGSYPVGAEDPDSALSISGGRYEIEHRAAQSTSFTWGAGGNAHQDVIIEVTAEQLSSENDNLYGVGCRLSTEKNGDQSGYVLLVSGDGHYGIARLNNRSLFFILGWNQSDAIHEGQASNSIRAVCIDDYLALYANGKFLGEASDSQYIRAGQVGLFAGVIEGQTARVTFDDLRVYEGTLKTKSP